MSLVSKQVSPYHYCFNVFTKIILRGVISAQRLKFNVIQRQKGTSSIFNAHIVSKWEHFSKVQFWSTHCFEDVKTGPCNIWLYVAFSWSLTLLHLAHKRILFFATRIERPLGLGSGKQGGTMWIGIDSIVSLQRPNIPFHIPEWASIAPQKCFIYTRKIEKSLGGY